MKHQAAVMPSIEVVADDGDTKSVTVRAVNPQLVGTSCLRVKGYACRRLASLCHMIHCNSLLAIIIISLLAWAVEIVGSKRNGNHTIVRTVVRPIKECGV